MQGPGSGPGGEPAGARPWERGGGTGGSRAVGSSDTLRQILKETSGGPSGSADIVNIMKTASFALGALTALGSLPCSALTVEDLQRTYGSRLEVHEEICSLPQQHSLVGGLKGLDCRYWVIKDVPYGGEAAGPFPTFDSRTLQAATDGVVVRDLYAQDGECSRALSTFLWLGGTPAFRGAVSRVHGAMQSTNEGAGEVTMKAHQGETSPGSLEASVSFRNGKCSLSVEHHTGQLP